MKEKYPLWHQRDPEYFKKDPREFNHESLKDFYEYEVKDKNTGESYLFEVIKAFQIEHKIAYEYKENQWYDFLTSILKTCESDFQNYVIELVGFYKERIDITTYAALEYDIRSLRAEFAYASNVITWKAFPHDQIYKEFTWRDDEFISTPERVDSCINEHLLKLKLFFEEIDLSLKSKIQNYNERDIHTDSIERPRKPSESPTEGIADVLKGVRWKRNKADLAELIKGLYYLEAIEKDGNPIELEDLQKIFESVFDIKIGDLNKSFRSRLESNKNIDNRLFLDQAGNRLDEMYREMAKEIRKERKKTP